MTTVGRVEVSEKPELTWNNPVLDRLYEHLAYEFELADRDLFLSRKLELITLTAEMYQNLLQNSRGHRVEWYIVVLIFVEIALSAYDLFLK